MNKEKVELQKATFGAGCFWGVEAAFREMKGVVSTAVGYMGGDLDNPSYQEVCTGTTDHIEVVEVMFAQYSGAMSCGSAISSLPREEVSAWWLACHSCAVCPRLLNYTLTGSGPGHRAPRP